MVRTCKIHKRGAVFKLWGGRYRCVQCMSTYQKTRRDKIKAFGIEFLGGKCRRCGYFRCAAALHFHHRQGTVKEFGVAEASHKRSLDRIKAELEKCILLCANCHAEEHNNFEG